MPSYTVTSDRLVHFEKVRQDWEKLQEQTDCSYFQSWGWIGSWLRHIAADLAPILVEVRHEKDLIGLAVFVHRLVNRHRVVNSNAMFLNEYPFHGRNMVIEYNGVLTRAVGKDAVYQQILLHLFEKYPALDEIFFGATTDQEAFARLGMTCDHKTGWRVKTLDTSCARSVDLAALENGMDAVLKSLSKNRRAQIRRAMRLYEEQGALKLEVAATIAQAQEYFSGLKKLHTLRWRREGKGGSFANETWERFHRSLIQGRMDKGEIQLIKVSCGPVEIGYLYNFIWRRHVYVLQTGFDISDDKHLMPGYVVHLMAMAHNKRNGMLNYDLMHGDAVYKKILCNQEQPLTWYVVQRKKMIFMLENWAISAVKRFKQQAL